MVTLRKAGPGDAAALALVGQATFLESYAGQIAGADILAHVGREHSVAYYTALLAKPRTTVWLAETSPGAAPVGYAVLVPPDLPLAEIRADDLELKRLYLLHRFHGTGLGRRLMDEACGWARTAGATRVLLGVYSENAPALAFYTRVGFTQVGERSFRVGDAVFHDYILARPLSA